MITKQRLSVAMIVTFLLSALPCSEMPARAEENFDVKALTRGNNLFAFDLYKQLRNGEGNIFFSPYSVSTALAMTYAGARGNTAKQMSEVLHFTMERGRLAVAFGHVQAQLNAVREKGEVELNAANGLWVQKDHRFLEDFLELVTKHYDAQLSYADFQTGYETARKEINTWIERQTNGKIEELIKRGVLNSLTRLVLANAIYFRGNWAAQFEKAATRDADFWVTPDTKVKVPMMSQEREFNYSEDGDAQLLELPYEGEELSMIILLPKKVDGLKKLEPKLGLEYLNALLASLKKREVILQLPKFKISSELNLGQTLGSMGMPDAFDPNGANFSGIDGLRVLFISAILHKAFVEVNEEGTEAAAATGLVMRITAAPVKPTMFRVDHPFAFLIRDNRSGSILFLGRIVSPQ